MRNEKQNNANWINKLDVPGCMPVEEMIDKNAAWEKLHKRLSRKPHKNKMIWYWAAAACLLIAFAVSIFTSKKQQKLLVKSIPVLHKKESIKSLHASSTFNKAIPAIENTLAVKKKESNPFITKHVNYFRAEKNISVNQTLSPEIENTNATKQQISINSFHSVDTISSITAVVAPVKKKMRVVHINELENASEGVALTAPYQQKNNFSIAIGNNNQPTKQTSVALDYAGIFKIKISSKN